MQMLFFSLFVKEAPKKGMDNQPAGKTWTLSSLISHKSLKQGGRQSLFWDVHEINLLIFLKISILVKSDVTELDCLICREKKDSTKKGQKEEEKDKLKTQNHMSLWALNVLEPNQLELG